jgi:catechol 2,3-dioxygenase-like lactoylglutathione lyase family enzyme
MLSAARVMSFLATSDAERATHFYRDVLGLTMLEHDPFALIFRVGETMLRISPVPAPVIAPYTVFGWEVDDIRGEAAALVAKGITFERFEGVPVDHEGICSFPNGDKVAWFKDPDGNLLSLAQLAG